MKASGHRVLITGGAKGIGLALARQFHAHGNTVVVAGRDPVALAQIVQDLPGVQPVLADIAREDDRAHLVQTCGDINILVNNAGVQHNGTLARMSAQAIESELAIDLLAPVLLTHALLEGLQQHAEAAVVNITSILALVPKQSASVYCASKAGLHSFTRSLRWQLEGTSVRVFELMPPLVNTAMTHGRGTAKMATDEVARLFWAGFVANRMEQRIGKAKVAGLLARWLPTAAERLLRSG